MSSVLTLLFAPTFLFLIHYFDFQQITLIYIIFTSIIVLYAFISKKKLEDYVILGIYLLFLSISYFNTSFITVKFIPVFTSIAFFTIFADAAVKKKELIHKITQKFYKKDLTEQEKKFLKAGDWYWAVALLIYIVVQVIIVFYASDSFWAIYSSIGWYIYFVLILALQIIYGKFYAIKMSS